MPDTHAPDTLPSSTRKPGRATDAASSTNPRTDRHTIHFVLQGKGGVGKTLAALLLAQVLAEAGTPLVCLDTDPVNASLTALSPFEAARVSLYQGQKLDWTALDQFAERIATEDASFVVDNGAASFVPITQFLIANSVADILAEHGRRMVVHVPVTGGSGMLDTVKGLAFILESFPASVAVVPWINELFGPAQNRDGKGLEELSLLAEHRARIPGVVRLAELNEQTTLDLRQMIERKLTFAEAIRRDNPSMMLLQRARLSRLRDVMWPQLHAVI